jgi:hypothetical protein
VLVARTVNADIFYSSSVSVCARSGPSSERCNRRKPQSCDLRCLTSDRESFNLSDDVTLQNDLNPDPGISSIFGPLFSFFVMSLVVCMQETAKRMGG